MAGREASHVELSGTSNRLSVVLKSGSNVDLFHGFDALG